MVDELLAAPRRLVRAIRRVPERLLHPSRHRDAHHQVGSRPRPRRILVVCHGNICRSPFAAVRLQALVEPLGVVVESAGFVGAGRPTPKEGIAAAQRFGVDLSEHRARVITAKLVLGVDLIVVMDARQAAAIRSMLTTGVPVLVLGDCDPLFAETRAIADPVMQPVEAFLESYTRIDRCVRQLATMVRRGAASRKR